MCRRIFLSNSANLLPHQRDIDSLFTSSKTTALVNSIAGLDDFEPISFLVIQNDRKI